MAKGAPHSRRRLDPQGARPAGLMRRLGGVVYDAFLVMALLIVLGFIGVAVNGGEANQSPLFRSLLLVAMFAFFGGCWSRSGMTLGMQAWRLRIETPQGHVPTLQQCLIRFVVAGLSLGACGLGYVWQLWDPEQRSWQDIASGTRVVVVPKLRRE
ncbi:MULTISPECIES: RDD family protein [Cobetia]|uniref:RDD family protein n=1 Tax=Cobetia TaxID=204286 RepID=UPI0005065273|nr:MULTISPECIES: RDD family protein [Cobetia]KGA02459.1 RDD protein [Cobetia amphilecti]UBU48990.1 RDD family protein [Cobetia amphilecti]BBO54987.1 hypothetical protein CLAM6_02980 [Cobetia sp. AM6]